MHQTMSDRLAVVLWWFIELTADPDFSCGRTNGRTDERTNEGNPRGPRGPKNLWKAAGLGWLLGTQKPGNSTCYPAQKFWYYPNFPIFSHYFQCHETPEVRSMYTMCTTHAHSRSSQQKRKVKMEWKLCKGANCAKDKVRPIFHKLFPTTFSCIM